MKNDRKGSEPLMVYVPTGTKAKLNAAAGKVAARTSIRTTLTDVVKLALDEWLDRQAIS